MKPRAAPPLHDCPDCGLALERGGGLHELAWHDCEAVQRLRRALADSSLSLEQATSKALQVSLDKMATASPRDAAAILTAIGSLHPKGSATGGGRGAPSEKASKFATRKD